MKEQFLNDDKYIKSSDIIRNLINALVINFE